MVVRVETKDTKTPPPKAEKPKQLSAEDLALREARTDGVNGIFQLAGLGTIMLGQLADAGAISLHGPVISTEVVKLAETDQRIAKGVDVLLQVGPYAGLVAAVMPLVMQLLANHKILPADKLGGVGIHKPETLEMQVRTQMEMQAIAAYQQQMEAEEELAKMRAEFEKAQAARNGDSAA